jgi:hypothetical protein
MRIGTGAFKFAGKLSKLLAIKSVGERIFGGMKKVYSLLKNSEIDEIIVLGKNDLKDLGVEKVSDIVIKWVKEGEAMVSVNKLKEMGFIIEQVDAVDPNSIKLIIKDGLVDLYVPVTYMDNGKEVIKEFQVFVKKQAGDIVDVTTDLSRVASETGWEAAQANAAELWKDYLKTVSSNEREILRSIYTVEGDVGKLEALGNRIADTALYQKVYKPVEDKLKKWILKIKEFGYRVSDTIGVGKRVTGTKTAIIEALQDTTEVTGQDGSKTTKGSLFARMLLGQDGIKDIAKTKEELIELLEKIKPGIQWMPEGLDIEVHQLSISTIIDAIETGVPVSKTDGGADLWNRFINYVDSDGNAIGQDIVEKMSKTLGWSYDEALSRSESFVKYQVFPAYQAVGGENEILLTSNVFETYFLDLARDWGEVAGVSQKATEASYRQVGLLVGYLEQNTKTLPMTKVAGLKEYVEMEAKKIIYLQGTALINPGTTYQNFLFRTFIGVPECEGNSICLVSKNAEYPIYLNEKADPYDVRIYRPVPWWENWLGWQAAMMQVPANPRFYVVSPCFAVAKIWKTNYNNKPTIFVAIDKRSVEGEASNYCYADEGLINTYTTIWALSDVGTAVEFINGFVLNRALKKATEEGAKKAIKEGFKSTANKIFNYADPVTLAQGIAEGFVSWPEYPWRPLNYDIMQKYAQNLGINIEDLK